MGPTLTYCELPPCDVSLRQNPVRDAALELPPVHTMEMAENHGFLCSMICGVRVPYSHQFLGTSD
jgi:hypothetical protein